MAATEWYASVGTIPTYNDAMTELATLASENTAWTYTTIGTSEQSRDIKALIIHPTGYSRTIMMTAAIHGSEQLTTRALLDFLHYMAANTTLYTGIRFIVVPIVNPDGHYASIRKNSNGVDLNRNFTIGWGETGGNPVFSAPSTDPASANYQGTDDLTESESIALSTAIDTYLGSGDVFLDCHTTMDLLLLDAGCTYKNVIVACNDYLRSNEHIPFIFNDSIPTGMMYSYAGAAGAYSIVIELHSGRDYATEANRYIGFVKSLAENSYAADVENDFSGDASCVAVWPFENPDPTADAKGGNGLTLSGGAAISAIAMQGATGLRIPAVSAGYARRADASLDSGFPGKSGETNRDFTIAFKFQLVGLPASGSYNYLCSKWATTAGQRGYAISIYNNSGTYELRIMIGTGTAFQYFVAYSGSFTLNAWYQIAVTWSNAARTAFVKFVDDDLTEIAKITDTTSITNDLFCGTAPFAWNCSHTAITTAQAYANAVYDLGAVFNEVKTESEIDQIFAGTYGASGSPYTISSDKGEFSLSGITNNLLFGHKVIVDRGEYVETGNNVILLSARKLSLSLGEFTLSLIDASLTYTPSGEYNIVSETGSFVLSGIVSGLFANRKLTSEQTSFDLTGVNLNLLKGFKLSLELGSFNLTGLTADLVYAGLNDFILSAEVSSYLLNGLGVNFLVNRSLSSNLGTFTLNGISQNLALGRKLVSEAQSYLLTGNAVAYEIVRKLLTSTGAYVITYNNASLLYNLVVYTRYLDSIINSNLAINSKVTSSIISPSEITEELNLNGCIYR